MELWKIHNKRRKGSTTKSRNIISIGTIILLLILSIPNAILTEEKPNQQTKKKEKDVYLEWKPVEGAVEYIVQIEYAHGWILENKVKTNKLHIKLPPGKYRIRIAGIDNKGNRGEWTKWLNLKVLPEEAKLPEKSLLYREIAKRGGSWLGYLKFKESGFSYEDYLKALDNGIKTPEEYRRYISELKERKTKEKNWWKELLKPKNRYLLIGVTGIGSSILFLTMAGFFDYKTAHYYNEYYDTKQEFLNKLGNISLEEAEDYANRLKDYYARNKTYYKLSRIFYTLSGITGLIGIGALSYHFLYVKKKEKGKIVYMLSPEHLYVAAIYNF